MSWTHVAFVESESDHGKAYEIKRSETGVLGCACVAYRFSKGVKTCKHLVALSAMALGDAKAKVVSAKASRPVRTATRPDPSTRVESGGEVFKVRRAMRLE